MARGRAWGDDAWAARARRGGLAARSAFKLEEAQRRFGLLAPGAAVLDLGCHPGGWAQVCVRALAAGGRGGAVVGVDLKDTPPPPGLRDPPVGVRVRLLKGDALRAPPAALLAAAGGGRAGFDCVLSDMMSDTAGVPVADVAASLRLAEAALLLSVGAGAGRGGLLRAGGHAMVKILQGRGSQELLARFEPHFERAAWFRPRATRRASREVYAVFRGRRRGPEGTA